MYRRLYTTELFVPLLRLLSVYPKFPVKLAEMQMDKADQMEIFKMTFGCSSQIGTEITIPFAQNVHKFVAILLC